MAEQQTEQDRSEPATPTKLREAQNRGQVTRSLELNSLFILGVATCIIYLLGENMIIGILAISRGLLSEAHQMNIGPTQLVFWFDTLVAQVISILWPLMLVIIVMAVLVNMAQTGPVFSFFPLKPDIQRINPVAGFKRLFSTRLLFESLKTLVKLFLFAGVLYFAIKGILPALFSLMDSDPDTYPAFILDNTLLLSFKLLAVLIFIALIDVLYTRWDYSKRMRMSRRELKEEIKRREGDPLVRAKIRELQKEAARRAGSLQKVPDADVLITNPTHISVALYYQRGVMPAPKVIAKGSGELALKMRELAYKHRVPVIENKRLARSLFRKVDLDQTITEELYPVVAKILVWVFALRGGHQGVSQTS